LKQKFEKFGEKMKFYNKSIFNTGSLCKTVLCGTAICGCCTILTGCGTQNASFSTKSENKEALEIMDKKEIGFQLELPEIGEEIAVINTSMGSFKLRFFPDEAPKAVENFKELSKKDYYNGIIFHRVIKNFMIQGGDPSGNGTGGQSHWGTDFEDEFSNKLFNINYSVAMANRGQNTNGSQFFINNRAASHEIAASITDKKISEFYEKYGGNPHLDGYATGKGHTVFAQVFEGKEIIDQISEVETNEKDKPKTSVIINNITIKKFEN
jgi:cyclophilin family peptidyl-prolyl cis-trans isomerase